MTMRDGLPVKLLWLKTACGRTRGQTEIRDYGSDAEVIDEWVSAGLCEIEGRKKVAKKAETKEVAKPPEDKKYKRGMSRTRSFK